MTDLLPSIRRTVVPIVVGWLLTVPIIDKAGIDQEQASAVVQALITVTYYVVGRLLEQVNPRWGWLLGRPGEPSYDGRHEA